jgi:hypothetical protein
MKWLFPLPWLIGGFAFFGLYKHADPFNYYTQGTVLMIMACIFSFLIWKIDA